MSKNYLSRFSSRQILTAGLFLIILCGALLLTLPLSVRNGERIPFLDAFFTSTSATCVTGLVVYDTWSQFTFFGQAVILFLIQIGGLGFMTIAILFSMILGRKIGLKERSYLAESVSALQLGGVVRLVRRILIGTLLLEGTGALILSLRFCPEFGTAKGIWYSIFHSVSAFCNAGFDLMGYKEPFSSFTSYSADIVVNVTVTALIISGGIGFIVWDDLYRSKCRFSKMKLHTRIMLIFTAVLIIVPAILMYILERDASMAGMGLAERALAAWFQVITPRTAGFNTIGTAALSEGGSLLTMLLMVIGAGVGSTGGGIKVTTFAVIVSSVMASIRGSKETNMLKRSLDTATVGRAFTGASLYLMLALCGCLLITMVQVLPLKDVMFEALSAIGTVGLTTGITRELLPLSRIIIILLMFAGRLGSLTVFMAATEYIGRKHFKNPEEKIIVG